MYVEWTLFELVTGTAITPFKWPSSHQLHQDIDPSFLWTSNSYNQPHLLIDIKMTFDIAKIARPNILTLEPYTCARDLFKTGILLDANENTHGPSIPDINASEEQLELNRYPDPHQLVLKQQICDFRNSEAGTEIAEVGIPDGKLLTPANLTLGVGSDESIDALLRCFVAPAREKLLICPPTYGMYNICATVNDVEIVKVPLSLPSFQVQVDSIMDTLSKDPSIKLIYVTSPGNPTSTKLNYSLVIEILEKIENGNFNVLFAVDEAYIDFSPIGSSLSVLVNKYPNLVVLQTLSKSFGLAGIRLGITYADPSVALLMNSMKYPYNISNLTSDVAIRATTKEAIASMRSKVAIINAQRDVLLKELLSLERIGENKGGLDSNFLLVEVLNEEGKPDNEVANKVYLELANEKEVVVRFRGKEYGCTGCLRITVGTEDENKRLVEAFKSVLAAL